MSRTLPQLPKRVTCPHCRQAVLGAKLDRHLKWECTTLRKKRGEA